MSVATVEDAETKIIQAENIVKKLSLNHFVLTSDLQALTKSLQDANYSTCLETSQYIIDFVWEKLNTGHWADVDDTWRNIYYIVNCYKTVSQLRLGVNQMECIKTCDLGILMGIKPQNWRLCLKELASSINKSQPSHKQFTQLMHCSAMEPAAKVVKIQQDCLPSEGDIPRVSCPSIESFNRDWMNTGSPVVLTNCMDYWPALHKWNLGYIKEVAGMRTVPIEIGARYTDDNWSQQLLTVSHFIDTYIINVGGETDKRGYLAQHQLFDQIPELMSDIIVPEYCCLGEHPDPDINAWFGPQGTISPLHQDPKPNLLCQVKGRKFVKMCHWNQTEYLYVNEGMLSNTSQIDAENIDLCAHPLTSKAQFIQTILNPGEMLFIPAKYWHYIRSLDVSFSVSFWWH